jgi:cytochrome oxidase Cu insertion factor (SCO1/SenC/PrrC family)
MHRIVVLGLACMLSTGCAERPAAVVGKPEPDAETAPIDPQAPFTLTDQNGAEFSSEELAGKVWLGAIFFANCPGPCFRENQAIAEILRGVDDPDFMVVSLTCDPTNDTPDVLRRYADRFDADQARWKLLTGNLDEIVRVGTKRFLLPVELGVHAEKGVVFDREGKLRGGYSLTDPDRAKLLQALIREVLAEKPATNEGGEGT